MSQPSTPKKITMKYFALLREQRGLSEEQLETTASTYTQLYQELQQQYPLTLPVAMLKVAINNRFETLETLIKEGDEVVFIPPVAGG